MYLLHYDGMGMCCGKKTMIGEELYGIAYQLILLISLRSLLLKVYSYFGPRPLRSLSTSVLCMRTELAKDQSDKGPKWMSRSVLRTEVDTD